MSTERLSFIVGICISLLSNSVFAQQEAHLRASRYYSRYLEEEKASVHVVKDHRLSIKDATLIYVNTQKEFDALQKKLEVALIENEGNIVVQFGKGPFFYKDEHVHLKNIYRKNVSLCFLGNKTKIISAGRSYQKGDKYVGVFSPDNVYLDTEYNDLPIWGKMYQADSLVEVIDKKTGLCRIHSSELTLPNQSHFDNAYLQLTEWYMSGIYRIDRVKGQYIYFIAHDLKPGAYTYGNYNVNYDYTVVKLYPRFRLCNIPSENAICVKNNKPVNSDFYECQSATFMRIYGSNFKTLDIRDIDFHGNAGGGMLFRLLGVNTVEGIHFHNCSFRGIKSIAVYLMSTSDTRIDNCTFVDCYSDAILATHKVKNTTVVNNSFENVCKGLKNSFAIHCQSAEYYIAGNTIVNFGYGGIGVGEGAGSDYYGSGIVENNLLYFTDSYANDAKRCSLIDGGAIYLWPKHKRTIIRYNRIHNYTGASSNRGIYCDDGAFGFSVYGNIITDVHNGNYIDSRMTPVSNKIPTNTDNLVMYNIVSGRYKFEGRPGANGCIKGQNIILINKEEHTPYNIVIKNIREPEQDFQLNYKSISGLEILVSREAEQELKKLPFYTNIRRYFKTSQ